MKNIVNIVINVMYFEYVSYRRLMMMQIIWNPLHRPT